MKSRINSRAWLYYAMITTVLWGIQAYIMKFAGDIKKEGSLKAECFVFYKNDLL